MAYKSRRERRAEGGKAETEPLRPEHGNQYNAKGSPEEREESAKSDGFKRGGAKKRKQGGEVHGEAAKHHLGKRARGGAAERKEEEKKEEEKRDAPEERARGGRAMTSGKTPFSSAHNTEPPGNKKDSGPGEQAPMIP